MQRHYLLMLLCCLFAGGLFAQLPGSGELDKIPVLQLPAQDNAALLAAELAARAPGRAPHYAIPLSVDVSPATGGAWTDYPGGKSVWRLRVISKNAISINLGFTEYWMPQGGELFLYPGSSKSKQIYGPFTPADNEVHNQLWTQVIEGDDLVIEAQVPTSEKANLRLRLTSVNHDFLGFGANSASSGSCNLDVVCSAADGWGIVDQYRDIIRSVAVIGTGGGTFCTGFLVNNARQDCTPYFMTANHCGINSGNASSLVTYWNFENSFCRQPNSGPSGQNGNGQLNVFNTGAIWRASNPASDMTIVELDDPVNPNADAFFAGWSREAAAPGDTVIAIHHPSTDEKRISFTFQQTYRVNGISTTPSTNGTHITIPDWDIGTTEGGSSGSPVYDKNKRVRGQLHGGGAACGNNSFDSYGYFHVSWEGGGSPNSRLRDWLDPDGTDLLFIDGREQLACEISVTPDVVAQAVCSGEDVTYDLLVGGGFNGPVTLSIPNLPAELTANFSQNPADPNTNVTLTITYADGFSGTSTFDVDATDGNDAGSTELMLDIQGTVPSAPLAISPANNSSGASIIIELDWADVNAANYDYEFGTNATLTNLLASGNTSNTEFAYGELLEADTEYFWRVRATNSCGTGEWSDVYSFTTANIVCGPAQESNDVGGNIPDNGPPLISNNLITSSGAISFMELNVEIDHEWVGDLFIRLVSPGGSVAVIMDRIGGGGCNAENFDLNFNDGATNTAADLQATCNNNLTGSFQSESPFTIFNGEEQNGLWRLFVQDQASNDDGNLISWSLEFCGDDGSGSDLSVQLLSDPIESCSNDDGEVSMLLGEGFGNNFTVAVSAGGQSLDFESTFANNTLDLTIDNFLTLASGSYDMIVTITTEEGESQTQVVPLTILPVPGIAGQVSPSNGSTVSDENIQFSWNSADNVDDYSLQVSTQENFSSIDYEENTGGTSLTVNNLGLEGLLYWRVVANNECGNATSSPFNFTVDPNATHDFSGGRELSIFPNPASSAVFLDMRGNWSGELDVNIMSVSGRVISTQQLAAGGRKALDISGLPAGTYLLDLRNGGERSVERLVILPN
ncbi:hypothetical protein CEQ90_10970 [Lewinellaceae bacterium SD302]|nr:hypothetical protein CEQ90_10970 [Lewinellaceae bacterium SD302]